MNDDYTSTTAVRAKSYELWQDIGPVRSITADQIKGLEMVTGDSVDVIVGAAIQGLLMHLGLTGWIVDQHDPVGV